MDASEDPNRIQRLLNRKKRPTDAAPDPTEPTQEGRSVPNLVKFAAIGATLIALPPLAGMLGGVLDFNPQEHTEPLPSAAQPSPPAESAPATDSTEASREAWSRVQVAKSTLMDHLAQTDTAILTSRAQQWWLFARQVCAKLGAEKCPSPYSFLSDRYLIEAAKLQRLGISGKFATDAQTTERYLQQRWVVQEIAEALSSIPSGSDAPVNWVASGVLTESIDELMRKARDFESLRLSQGGQPHAAQR